MRRMTKQDGLGLTLVFSGLRWPTAQPAYDYQLATALLSESGREVVDAVRRSRGCVDIAVHSGEGRIWTPESVDASWRNFATLELGSEKDSVAFVQRRGDPLESRPTPFHINTAQWIFLQKALLLASALWGDPDKNGVSYPLDQPTGVRAFFDDPFAMSMVKSLNIAPHPSGIGLAVVAPTLGAFLIARAALAIEKPMPMRRCLNCGFWFEIRRILREPRFCSASCRTLNHQHQKEASQHGIGKEEPHREGDAAVAGSLGRTSGRRKDAATNEKLRHSKGSERARSAHGGRGRTTRHRRPPKA
jgi:hypothetical protein